jgi:hypothetical protein
MGLAVPASALSLDAIPEGVRIDLERGVVIDGAEGDAPMTSPRFRAAKDEVIAFQARLTGEPGAYRVRAPELAGLHVDVFIERGVRVTTRSKSDQVHSLGPAVYPDILIPSSTVTVPPAPAVAMLWIDVYVPRDAKTGAVTGALIVENERTRASLTIEIEVTAEVLPERDVAGLGAVNFGSLLEREKRDPQLLLRWMQLAHAHHLTIELMRPVPKIGETIDWQGWAQRIAAYVDGSAFTPELGYVGPRAGQPITRFVAPLCEWWPVKPRDDGFLPSDPAAWSRALAEWEQLAIARGWFSHPRATQWIIFINSLDEPKTAEKLEAIAAYAPLIEAAHLQDRDRVWFRVDGVLGARIADWPDSRKLAELAPVVDVWNLHGATDTAPILANSGERFMFYASNSGGEPAIPPLAVDSAIAGARAWAWIVERYHLAGALNWEVDLRAGCLADPLCSEGRALNLDALLIYRGEEVGRTHDEPIASMRLKALRRGAQDVAKLALRDAGEREAIARTIVPRALGDDLPKIGLGRWPRRFHAYDDALSGRTMVDLRWIAAIGIALVAALSIWIRRRTQV